MRTSFPGRPLQARGAADTLTLCLVLVLLGTGASACSGDPSPSPEATARHVGATSMADPTTTSQVGPSTSTRVGRVVGRLPVARRRAVQEQVTSVIDRWWEAAYLSDPQDAEVSSAFPGFTAGARRRAHFDRELMTNATLEASSLTPLMRKVRLDLLAVSGRARSVTSRFDLRVRVAGPRSGRLQVRGRLFLTRGPSGWRVFGYDVSKGWL